MVNMLELVVALAVADRFQYAFHVCNTESGPRCVLIGSKLAGLLTAKC